MYVGTISVNEASTIIILQSFALTLGNSNHNETYLSINNELNHNVFNPNSSKYHSRLEDCFVKVIICEDNNRQRQFLHSQITNYATFHEPSIEIVLSASDPEEVLTYTTKHRADCYFLDIELNNELDGLDLATEIRKRDPLASIIFVTTYADKLKLTFTYKVAALDFIVKDEPKKLSKQVIAALKAAFAKYKQLGSTTEDHIFQIKIGERIKNILLEDIYFFETATQIHKVELHEKHGYYEFYSKLKELENLDDRFYRCHKSFIINLQHVQEINIKKRTVKMPDNSIIPVSYRAMGELQKKIQDW